MILRPFPAISLLAVLSAGPALAQETCAGFPIGAERHECRCPAEAPARTIWGSGPYTADSDFCTAARHAGVIGVEGGPVVALAAEPLEFYPASTANDVSTSEWGPYPNAFRFEGASDAVPGQACGTTLPAQAVFTCGCPAGGAIETVWGSDPYTADSDICTAARHAGVIDTNGGEVTLRRIAGQPRYEGTFANGVTSLDYDDYGASFTFRTKP